MKQRITIDDVAKAAGVSRQTVSRAINDKSEIHPSTKAHIMQIIRELGYRPSRMAQGMVTQRTFAVGIVIGDITNPFFPEVTRGVQDVAQAHNYHVFFCNSDDKPQRELHALRSLAAQGVDGIILFSHQASDAELAEFASSYRPIVLVNRAFDHPNVALLTVGHLSAAHQVADYLIDGGHRTIGMLTNDGSNFRQSQRVRGFVERAQQRGVAGAESRVVAAPATLQGGYEAAKKLLAQHPQTTAVFAFNDLMAVGAMRACSDLGLQIPQDMSIVGFDDIPIARMLTPALTTVQIDKYLIGRLAMQRILDMIEKPNAAYDPLKLEARLMVRESVRSLLDNGTLLT